MNALTKKVILSLFTWILIFITLGTSTFAWFSMNYTVSATDLNITVTSNSTYLLIGNRSNVDVNKLGLTRETVPAFISGGDGQKRVSPAFYGDGSVLGNVTTVAGKWYTAYNEDLNHSNNKVVNVSEISSTNLQFHILTYKVWLTLSGDSQPYNNRLTINFDKISGDDAASIVVELTNENNVVEKFQLDVNNLQATTTGNVYVDKDTAYEITFYVYVNGNGDNVYDTYLGLYGINADLGISFDIFA